MSSELVGNCTSLIDDVVDGTREARPSSFADARLKRIDSSWYETVVFVSCAKNVKKTTTRHKSYLADVGLVKTVT